MPPSPCRRNRTRRNSPPRGDPSSSCSYSAPSPQPERVGQQARHAPVVPAVLVPEGLDPRAEHLDIVLPKHVQNLCPALSVGCLCQHRQRHVHVQRRADPVFPVASREQRGHHRQKPLREAAPSRSPISAVSGARSPRSRRHTPRSTPHRPNRRSSRCSNPSPAGCCAISGIHRRRQLRRQKGARLLCPAGSPCRPASARRRTPPTVTGRRHGQAKCKNLFHVPRLLLVWSALIVRNRLRKGCGALRKNFGSFADFAVDICKLSCYSEITDVNRRSPYEACNRSDRSRMVPHGTALVLPRRNGPFSDRAPCKKPPAGPAAPRSRSCAASRKKAPSARKNRTASMPTSPPSRAKTPPSARRATCWAASTTGASACSSAP